MAQVSVNYPVIGNSNSTEDPKVITALETLVTAINSLDDANIASNAGINGSKLLNASLPHSKIAAQTIDVKNGSYALVTGDANKIIAMNGSSAQTVTLDSNLNLATGQRIDVLQTGTGQVTFAASSTTVNGTPTLQMRDRYSAATVLCTAPDTYVVIGDLA